MKTDRLEIRLPEERDAEDILEYASNPKVTKNVLWDRHEDINDSLQFISRAYWDATDFVLDFNGKVIGSINFSPVDYRSDRWHIGFILNPKYWGQGLMTEAVNAIVDYGFNKIGVHRIEAIPRVENEKSRKVLEKCGFQFEAVLSDVLKLKDGKYYDVAMYRRLSNEQ